MAASWACGWSSLPKPADPDLGQQRIASNLHFWRYAQEAKRNGAKLVCIDPRKSETADKCHEHLQLLPGTDAALALALMHELIRNDWLDHDYIAQHTLGWDALKARALQWPPERAAVCGLQVADPALARDYGTTRPAAIRLNYGMQRARGGGNAVRAIACLPPWSAPGATAPAACCCPARACPLQQGGAAAAAAAGRPPPAHAEHEHHRRCAAASRGRHWGPQVEAVVVYNSNPVAVAPSRPRWPPALPAKTCSPWCWSIS
jgi:anaerobic selenocysteine-containing dehydrogenase